MQPKLASYMLSTPSGVFNMQTYKMIQLYECVQYSTVNNWHYKDEDKMLNKTKQTSCFEHINTNKKKELQDL